MRATYNLDSSEFQVTDIGIIPHEWHVASIGELAETSSGTTPPRSAYDRYYKGGTIAWVKTLDLNNSDIRSTEERVTPEALAETSLRVYPSGTVLVAMYGGLNQIGRTGRLSLPAAVNQALTAIRPRNGSVDSRYLLRVLNHRADHWRSVASSSRKDPNITSKDVRDFVLAIPRIEEQRAIAEALADADALIESLELLLAKKCQIKQGSMQELLTGKKRLPGFSGKWESKVLGQSAILKARIGWQGLTTKEYLSVGDFYLVTGTELRGGAIDWDECSHVEATRYKQDPNIQLTIDDVLVTKDGTIGKVGIVTSLPKPATLNSGIFVVRPLGKAFHPGFFYYLLCSSIFIEFLDQLAAGSTISHLYQKDFVGFSFQLPPTEDEQKAIASVLADMDSDIALVEKRLWKACGVKQGMMQALLTGRIRLVKPASNIIPLPTKPIANMPSGQPAHNWQINEAVVIGMLAKHFGSEQFPLPRKRRVKLTYLLHRHADGRAEGYLKKAAGPYDPNTKYKGPEQIALKNGYVRALRNEKYEGFVAGDKIEQAQCYFEQWYGAATLEWLERFHYRKTDELELLATVDMAMVDLTANSEPADVHGVKRVIAAHPEWLPKLSRELFSDERIATAITECQTLFAS
ncbi:restriction endonuclease subunit S [Achromobacter sp. Marseille-Q0513]|uniref:restriction endonuclease subunit S n=1 Tax=Achromobacter sp. Marseille-Q0513 TaxID=2829161 RepID=UPI001B96C3B7|nr:restriction endonuclease subunit S [Achromobacter sp. Marseille-Q0513]MBR8655302.1 restriction endonuclease subunit S [Achromobacter sp. Marseille-Q0513]